MKFFAICTSLLLVIMPARAQSNLRLDELIGEWTISYPSGEPIGRSTITVQAADAMIYELRQLNGQAPESIWFENSVRAGGWIQLSVSPYGVLEMRPRSPSGRWPLVLHVQHVWLHTGPPLDYRLTISPISRDELREVLQFSPDHGHTWETSSDYIYRRSH